MLLAFETTTGLLTDGGNLQNRQGLAGITVKGGQDEPVSVQFTTNGVPSPVSPGLTAIYVGIKPLQTNGVGAYETDWLANSLGNDNWTVPFTGTGAGYLINHSGGYSANVTSLVVDTGTGTILVGDTIQIGSTNYTVTGGITGAGTLTIAGAGLTGSVADNATVTVLTNYSPATTTMTVDSDAIRAGLGIDGTDDSTNDKDTLAGMFEFGYTPDGAERPRRSLGKISTTIQNWVNQGDESPIDAAPASPGNNKVWSSNSTGTLGYHNRVPWEIKTSDFTAVVGTPYQIDTSANAVTMTIPVGMVAGDEITAQDGTASGATNNLTIAVAASGFGTKINGGTSSYTNDGIPNYKLSLVAISSGFGVSIK